MLSSLLFLPALMQAQTLAPVTLQRVGQSNEQMSYGVKSHIQIETRFAGLDTWMPQGLDLNYDFSTRILTLSPGGMMELRYSRPTMTQILGETFDSPPKTTTDKLNLLFQLTLSPVNEIVAEKNLTKPDKKAEAKGGSAGFRLPMLSQTESLAMAQGNALQYVREIYQLALNVGSLDTSLDFDPKLPLDSVKPGDTWEKTVGYSPQNLKGQKDQSVAQRLDYTYTYVGLVDLAGKKVYQITADLNLHTDLAALVTAEIKAAAEEDGEDQQGPEIKALPLNLVQHLVFDLDPKTCETLSATTQSQGGFSLTMEDHPNQPAFEQRFKGTSEMNLESKSG